jgi:hypothetical protein
LCIDDLLNEVRRRKKLFGQEQLSHMSLTREFCMSSEGDLKNYVRMSDECFKVLLILIKPFIAKQNTRMRRAISAPFCKSVDM